MINAFVNAVVKGVTDKNDHTISKIVSFFNCLFVLLLVTSMFFPLKEILATHLVSLDIELTSDIALVVWYCAIFLFWISTSISFVSYIIYATLNKVEKKSEYKKSFEATNKMHTFFCAAHTAYLGIFDYIALSSFALLFIAPDRLLSVFKASFQWGNIFKNISMIFVALGAIECTISIIILIAIKWVMPDYYRYKHISDEIYKD